MEREIKPILFSTALIVLAAVLQSSILHNIAIKGVKPDLALIILIFVSLRKGSMTGQVSGFASGLVEDFLSLSPLGFHAFFRAALGYLYGRTAGTIFIDPIVMPVIMIVIGTLIKGLVSSLLIVLFSIPAVGFAGFGGRIWVELAYNALLAPFLFGGLGLLKTLKQRDKDELWPR